VKLSSNVLATATWGKSHRALILLVLLFAFLAVLVGWYYVVSARQVSRVMPESSQQPLLLAPAPASSALNGNTTIQTTTQSSDISPIKTRVHVNGQPIQVPQTGTVHNVIQDPSGTTTVDISVDANSSDTSSTSSSTNIELNSSSEVTNSSESTQHVP
jgi:hypothetical protein